jgi:hypothetical protein
MTGSFSADPGLLMVAADDLDACAKTVASAEREFDEKAYLPDSAFNVFANAMLGAYRQAQPAMKEALAKVHQVLYANQEAVYAAAVRYGSTDSANAAGLDGYRNKI